jgi:hypothetical protein
MLLSHGRQIWRDLLEASDVVRPQDMTKFMKSLFHGVNAVAELSGPPIYERRLMLEFLPRAETAQRPMMNAELVNLMGASALDTSQVNSWLSDWKLAFEAASEISHVDARIHPARLNYYEKAIQSMLAGETPHAATWPLLQTWSLAADVLPDHFVNTWRTVCGQLGFTTLGFEERVERLDKFLDEVEALLDELAVQYGLETSTSI